MSEFREKALLGVSWNIVNQIGKQVPRVAISILLANLLSPREFGLLAMITVITGFADVFTEMGFGAALIQKRDLTRAHLSSVFWINLASGIALTLGFVAGAPLLADFYNEPVLAALTAVVAFTFTIRSLAIVQRTLFQRDIDFKALSIAEITSVIGAGTVAVVLAVRGFGVWSLVAQTLLEGVLVTILLWFQSDWRPAFRFRWDAVRDLLGFSASLLGTRSMNYWSRQADDLLVGKVIGSGALGTYRLAYDIMLFPLSNISRVISRVMFPSLAAIQEDRDRVRRVFLRMTRTIALVTFPLMLGLLATTEPFVMAVFGDDWRGMIPILRIFALLGLTQSIGTLAGNLFLSQGRADLQFRIGLFVKPFKLIAIVVGLQWGVEGVAWAYALASWTVSYPIFRVAGGLVDLTYSQMVKSVAGVFGCAATMAAAVYGLGVLVPAGWSWIGQLALQVGTGAALYGALVHITGVEAYRDTWALLREQWVARNRQTR